MSPDEQEDEPLPLEIRNKIVEHFISQRENLGARIDAKTESGAKVAAQLDRTLVTLSGGALIFSMTFIDKIAPARLEPWLLFAAWLAFGLSMVAVMLAMRGTQQLITEAIRQLSGLFTDLQKAETEALKTGRVSNVVPSPIVESHGVAFFNATGIIAFGVGLILLTIFVGHNIRHAPPPEPRSECHSIA